MAENASYAMQRAGTMMTTTDYVKSVRSLSLTQLYREEDRLSAERERLERNPIWTVAVAHCDRLLLVLRNEIDSRYARWEQ